VQAPQRLASEVPDSAALADPDTPETRGAEAGLSPSEIENLLALDVPVYVPTLPSGWASDGLTVETGAQNGIAYPSYALALRTSEGACLTLEAASEGIGDVFVQEPPQTRDILAPGVPTTGSVPLGWSEPGSTAEGWEEPRVSTEWFGIDGLSLMVRSESAAGCPAASANDVETLVAVLRPLDPADEALQLGPFEWTDLDDRPYMSGEDPEALALAAVGPSEAGEGNQETVVETLRLRESHAVVLVTTTNLTDDSVRDERLRVVLQHGDSGWVVLTVARQVRCQPGRGHTDWTPALCG
jgi:hypothetical protein